MRWMEVPESLAPGLVSNQRLPEGMFSAKQRKREPCTTSRLRLGRMARAPDPLGHLTQEFTLEGPAGPP
jgi:hypothetical protein